MPLFTLSSLTWKFVLSILVFVSTLLFFSELRHAWLPLTTGEHGSLGVVLYDQVGLGPEGQDSNQLRITQLFPDSPLLAAGARVDDVLSFDQPIDRWRKFTDREEVNVTLLQDGNARQLRVVAHSVPITLAEYVDYLSRAVLVLPALLFSLLIGFKGADDPANRRLAMTFIALSLNIFYNFNYSPGEPVFEFSKLANVTTYGLIWFGAAAFALTYRNEAIALINTEQPPSKNDWLNRLFRWYRALAALVVVYSFWFALGYETPGLWVVGFIGVLCGLLMLIVSLADGWRRSKGELRQRHLWLLFSVSANAFPSFLTWIPSLDWSLNGVLVTVMLSFVGQVIMYIGLTYAVLKHRIFNFNFAISRALLTSTISLILLGAFELVKLFVEEILQQGSANPSKLERRDLVIAVMLFLAFHKLHDRVRNLLERFFFQAWYENEQRLRKFVKDAAHILSTEALLAALISALDRFTGGAGAAIYLLEPNGGFKLAAGSMALAPAMLDADDGMVVALRSDMKALQLQDSPVESVFSGELALPMSHRGHLNGFVVLQSKASGSSYRPDELAVLSFAVDQIGLDLLASKVAVLEMQLQLISQPPSRLSTVVPLNV
jgi:hypothetical protein